ncbi:MAG: YicC/YloC family endoribonuclease [Rhabdochlamydiaceae bacterium]
MIKSMTAFAKDEIEIDGAKWLLELHSVNRRNLEFSLHIPKDLLHLDIDLRNWVGEHVKRGHISIRLSFQNAIKKNNFFTISEINHLQALKADYENISDTLQLPKESITLSFLLNQFHLLSIQNNQFNENVKDHLKDLVEKTLIKFKEMKRIEGEALEKDLRYRISLLEKSLKIICGMDKDVLNKYQNKLLNKMAALDLSLEDMQDRLLKEAVIWADKSDITEEIVRLESHLAQFLSIMKSDEKTVGRTLDFLCQEIHRELNTMGAKSVDVNLSYEVLNMKTELEKIREQVQNIE